MKNSQLKQLEYISSDESVAKVDENGKITYVGAGKCNVTVRLKDNPSISQVLNITVNEDKKDNSNADNKVTDDNSATSTVSDIKSKDNATSTVNSNLKFSQSNNKTKTYDNNNYIYLYIAVMSLIIMLISINKYKKQRKFN